MKTGRTRNPAVRKPGERATLSIRIPSDLWHRLDQAARITGHSLSAEVEVRLQRSFATDDAFSGPARDVIHHLVAAFGTGTDTGREPKYMAAFLRVFDALVSRWPEGGLSPVMWDVISKHLRRRIEANQEGPDVPNLETSQ